MDGTRIQAFINYHRTIYKTSNLRIASNIGRSVRVYQDRLIEPEKFTLKEILTILDTLHCNNDDKRDFWEEVLKSWEEKDG